MQTLVADHPLVAHKLTALRDVQTETPTFRRLTDELVTLLAYEATRHIKVEPVSVTTPVAVADGVRLAQSLGAARVTLARELSLDEVRKVHIQKVLQMCNGNRLRAAQILGIGRTSLYRYLKRDGYDTNTRATSSGAAA